MVAPHGYISVNDAAAQLAVKPHEVTRLIEAGTIQAVTLVAEESVKTYRDSA